MSKEKLVCKKCKITFFRNPSRNAIFCSNQCGIEFYRRKPVCDFSSMSSESCYWGGFLFGDGSIDENYKLQLCLSNLDGGHNLLLMQKFCDFIYGIGHLDYLNIYPTKIHIQINDKTLSEQLSDIYNIIPRKTYNATVKIPKYNKYDFIRGYIDADGWMGIYKTFNKKQNKYYSKYSLGLCGYLKQNMEIVQKELNCGGIISKKKTQELYELRYQKYSDIVKIKNLVLGEPCLWKKWNKIQLKKCLIEN